MDDTTLRALVARLEADPEGSARLLQEHAPMTTAALGVPVWDAAVEAVQSAGDPSHREYTLPLNEPAEALLRARLEQHPALGVGRDAQGSVFVVAGRLDRAQDEELLSWVMRYHGISPYRWLGVARRRGAAPIVSSGFYDLTELDDGTVVSPDDIVMLHDDKVLAATLDGGEQFTVARLPDDGD